MTHGTGLLLFAAVAGYWVLERSSGHKGDLKRVGQVIGWVVILASFAGLACKVWALSTGNAPFCLLGEKGKSFCPFASKLSGPSTPSK